MKKTLLALLCATSMLGGISMSYAAEDGDMLPPPPPPAEDVLPPHDAPLPPHDAPRPHKFDKKDMKKFEERMAEKLNLTEEQKAQAEKINDEGREKMKPLMDQMKEIRKQMDEIRQDNMEQFEAILTPEQKTAFDNMKKPHHDKDWKDRKDKKKKHHKKDKKDKKD